MFTVGNFAQPRFDGKVTSVMEPTAINCKKEIFLQGPGFFHSGLFATGDMVFRREGAEEPMPLNAHPEKEKLAKTICK